MSDTSMHSAEDSTLAQKLALAQAEVQALQNSLSRARSSGESGRTLKLQSSIQFDGTPSNLRVFLLQLKLFFNSDPVGFQQDRDKINFCCLSFTGKALHWVAPYLENPSNHPDKFGSWPIFEKWLRSNFEDLDLALKSAHRLGQLRQNGTVSAYVSEFDKWAVNLSDWGDKALLHYFYIGLSDEVKLLLTSLEEASTLKDAQKQCLKIGTQLLTRDFRMNSSTKQKSSNFKPSWKRDNPIIFPIPRERIMPAADVQPQPTPFPPTNVPIPMDVDAIQTRLSNEEKNRRRANNLCLYCGASGHFRDNCPILALRGNSRIKTSQDYFKSNSKAVKKVSISASENIHFSKKTTPGKLLLTGHLSGGPIVFSSLLFVDSGANDSFISEDLISVYKIPTVPSGLINLVLADGSSATPVSRRTIPLTLRIKNHFETISFLVMKLSVKQIILGHPWLKLHEPSILWSTSEVRFVSNFCGDNCSNSKVSTQKKSADSGFSLNLNPAETLPSEKENLPVADELLKVSDTVDLEGVPLHQSVYPYLSTLPTSEENVVPQEYETFEDVFNKVAAEVLPAHRKFDCDIPLQDGAKVPFGKIYDLSQEESTTLKEYIDENLAKGFIRRSHSPGGAPCFFVKKKDGSLRLCIDYRGLNKVTIKNRHPLPLISEIIRTISKAKIFTALDLRGAYNLVRIAKGEEWKTAFRTKFGHFEYCVMPFGLTNAPAIFQGLMQEIFHDYLDIFVVIYLDDILIFSENVEDHSQHVKLVLERLRENQLYCKLQKCVFNTTSLPYLGYIISTSGISMDPAKVSSVISWPTPKSAHDIQVFLGFANYYRRFVAEFSRLTKPLSTLLKKDSVFNWTPEVDNAFVELKKAFSSAPFLVHADVSLPFVVESDASDFALGAVLSQTINGILKPIAFHSRQLLPAERNYTVHDKELLAIIDSLKVWRHYLQGAKNPFIILCDHKNLTYFMELRQLSRRQARWANFLSGFDFEIRHVPGAANCRADALSRRPDYFPLEGGATTDPTNLRQLIPTVDLAAIEDNISNDKEFIKEELRQLDIIENRHCNLQAGHYGLAKTLELIQRDFYWPKMSQMVKKFIDSCSCIRSKSSKHSPYGLLNPLPIPDCPWKSISTDFIVELPLSNGYNAINVWVCRLTKMAHFIPCNTTITAKGTVDLFMTNIFRLHGLPSDIISDRGPQFISKLWANIHETLKIKVKLSTSFHPQTDGQTEKTNSVLEQYLRNFINYQQDNWVSLLPFAEFSFNNSINASTKTSPFMANYGFNPRMDFLNLDNAYVKDINEVLEKLKDNLSKAQERQKFYADKKRIDKNFKINDLVLLNTKNIRTTRPSKKLDLKKIGPFKVLAKIGNASYRLELPLHFKIHNVFHVSLLENYSPNPWPSRIVEKSPPIEIEDHYEYEVEEILDSKIVRKKLKYLVKWLGYELEDSTWEPLENLANCPELIKKFHELHPNKPKKGIL